MKRSSARRAIAKLPTSRRCCVDCGEAFVARNRAYDRGRPMKSVITGTGIGIPKNVVKNDALAKIMDTSDEWIRTRSGIEQRHYADDGQGSAELGSIAAQAALDVSGRSKKEIDAIIFATMTPNYFFPGNGPVIQAKMGSPESMPTFDIRQQ